MESNSLIINLKGISFSYSGEGEEDTYMIYVYKGKGYYHFYRKDI